MLLHPRGTSRICGYDSVMDPGDQDCIGDDGWFELIWFSDWSHFLCHTRAYSPFRSGFVDLPLIHVKLMIWFHFVLILWEASLESFNQIHTLWYSCDSWTELSQVSRFPRHHFSGVHIRSFTHPHGVVIELSGQIGYIWCHTGAYFPPLAVETIVFSQIRYNFHHSAKIDCICLTDRYSCDFRRDELLVEHDVRVLITLLAMTL